MTNRGIHLVTALLLLATVLPGCAQADGPTTSAPDGWGATDTWEKPTEALPDPARFVQGVDNPYFPLSPGSRWVYESRGSGDAERIVVVVLEETRTVAGIECVVVRDTVSVNGAVVEDTYDWYAQDTDGNVWYMGEDSTEFEDGKPVSTAGSWEAGVDGALPGIKVWGEPHIGGVPYYQEYYVGEAEDLGRDIQIDGEASVPVGDYADVLVVEEWAPLAPEAIELKYYAAGVGVVMEETTRGGDEVIGLVEFAAP